MRRVTFRDLLELVALAALCLVAVGPTCLLPGAAALGRPTRDLYDHLALLDAWFLHTGSWSFPEGGSLVPPDPMGMLIAAPALALGLGRAVAYNLTVVVRLWMASAGGWLLGRRVGSGLVGGVCFGLSPFLFGEAFTGEAETLSAWPLPVMALLLEVGGTPAFIGAGVVAAIGAMGSWYYGTFLTLYLGVWTLVKLRRRSAAVLVPAVVFVGVVAVPALVYANVLAAPDQLFRGPDMATYLASQPRALAQMVSDPAYWFLGGPAGATHEDRLGITIVGFALLGLFERAFVGRGWWLAVTLAGLVLSLGPILHVAGDPITDLTPYRLLAQLPLFGLMRLPHRWLLVASLGLAVLAARGARGAPWLAAGLIVLETLWFGAPAETPVPLLPSTELAGPVLDLPPRTMGTGDARGLYLLWQRTHGRPVPYSLSMSGWSGTLAEEPLMVAMAALDRRDRIAESPVEAEQFRQGDYARKVGTLRAVGIPATAAAGAAERLRGLGVTDVVLHLDLLDPADVDAAVALATDALGATAEEDDVIVHWRL